LLRSPVVREVLVSADNRATGVRYTHRVHQREGEVRGRTVVVACACVQSIALLLMSSSRRYPNGLANSSGQLGRHFIPHFTGGIECVLEGLRGTRPTNDEGFLDHAYLPSFTHTRKRDYARSFGAQVNYQNRRSAGWAKTVGGFGRGYKAAVKAAYPAFIQFTPYGEMLPNAQSYVDLDREKSDKFGLPLARRHVRWGKNEESLFNDMVRWSLSTPTAARTTCRTSTWSMAAYSRRRRRRTRPIRSWRLPRVPRSTLPSASRRGICDGDAATCPEAARRPRRHVRLPFCRG
jgi:glucoside 3-dehydrogenase (cytochrome c) catalytic subunit